MRTKTTLVLSVLGAAVLALGIYYGSGPGEQTDYAAQGRFAFPDLAPKLADAAQIELVHGGQTLHLTRTGTKPDAPWGVADRGGYPALPGKVHALLTALTELRLDEPRTSDPSEYGRLGVEDPKTKGSASTLVRVLNAKGDVIAALIVGHSHAAQHGDADTLYVRRPGAAQSWLADGRIEASSDRQDWLDRNIIDIADKNIAAVTVTRGGAVLKFGRKDNVFTLTDPADHPKLDDFKVDEISRGLSELTLEDVKPAPAPGTKLAETVFTTTDGTVVTVDTTKQGPELWATFTATGKDTAPIVTKVKGWAYLIGSWKEDDLAPTLDGLKAPDLSKPPPKTPVATAPATQ